MKTELRQATMKYLEKSLDRSALLYSEDLRTLTAFDIRRIGFSTMSTSNPICAAARHIALQ